jgi:kynurenine formamidase
LISPAAVINISQQAERNSDYQITQQDIINWEKIHGSIPSGSFVIANTGWTKYWNDPKKFIGLDKNQVRHFPGWGGEAAQYLLEKGVRGLGIDTVSIDAGNNNNFDAHKVFLKADKYLVENINIGTENENILPEVGATVFVLPIPIENGSEAPARIIAYV